MLIKLYSIKNKFIRKVIYRFLQKVDGGEMWSLKLRELYKKYYNIEIGIGTYGYNTVGFPKGTKIGKYCSLASYITIINVNHSMNTVTTHPFLFNPVVGFVENDYREKTNLVIGNDVWIGQNTLILSKVNEIGNGAVIGAGSVVTKNVPSYSIVAGNPARVLGYRFDPKTINELEKIQWWNFDVEHLKENLHLYKNPQQFVKHYTSQM